MAAVVTCVVLAVSSCGSDDDGGGDGGETTAAPTPSVAETQAPPDQDGAPADIVTLHPVLEMSTTGADLGPAMTLDDAVSAVEGGAAADRAGQQSYLLGPGADLAGIVEPGAQQQVVGDEWSVFVGLSREGSAAFNEFAAECYSSTDACPTSQLAIVLNGEVVSAPTVQEPSFGEELTITGQFSEAEAREFAQILDSLG
jgi:preprotein translocase subunit SecD